MYMCDYIQLILIDILMLYYNCSNPPNMIESRFAVTDQALLFSAKRKDNFKVTTVRTDCHEHITH